MKICNICKIKKELIEFNKQRKDNLVLKTGDVRAVCKNCLKEKCKTYRDKNKDSSSLYKKKRKEELIIQNKEYRIKNKEKIDKWRIDNKKYFENWKKNNPKYHSNYINKRSEIDFIFKFKNIVRNIICKSFRRGKANINKEINSDVILGCSIDFFKEFIFSKFKKDMTFENYGKWHLDHIIPLASAKTTEEVVKLCHYTNFQPLWKTENLKKGSKIIEIQLTLL